MWDASCSSVANLQHLAGDGPNYREDRDGVSRNRVERNSDGLINALSDISNNVGPVKLFLNTLLSFHLKELFSFAFFGFLSSRIDDHSSFVI
jgi:hypothetical protein